METYTLLGPALAQWFDNRVRSVINRSAVLAQLLPVRPSSGKNVAWDVRLGDADNVSTAPINEGADVSTFEADLKAAAVLQFGNYHRGIKISGLAEMAAMAAGNPADLAMLVAGEIDAAAAMLAKTINKELYTGTGATNRIHGLLASGAPAIGPTGSYAGINPGTSGYEQWAGTDVDAGGAPISFELLRQLRREVYVASGKKFDLFVCDPTQYAAIGALFGEQRRWTDTVRTANGSIKLAGGFTALEFDGIAIVEDVDCPAGYVLGLNTSEMHLQEISMGATAYNDQVGKMLLAGTAEEQFGERKLGLSTRLKKLAALGDHTKLGLFCNPQLCVASRNAHGYISDLDLAP